MTDRHCGYIVTLADNIREDDAKDVINALSHVKGVLSVRPIVNDPTTYVGYQRAKSDFMDKLFTLIEELGK